MLAPERSKEALAMIALHEALRNVCVNYDWTYAVFWTIRPRPRCRGATNCKVAEENGGLMLMWEDGFCQLDCRSQASPIASISSARQGGFEEQMLINGERSINADNSEETEDPIWKAFRKMSIQLYNYGEGLMGKVASDKCHKWVFKESPDCEVGIASYWQSSFDAHPPEWADQFAAGIQTIAVIQAGQGLLQLGSCKVIPEDLHFVLRMRHAFESLEYPCGLFLPQQPFGGGLKSAGNANIYSSSTFPLQPPSPHSWSLCTMPTSMDQSSTRLRALAAPTNQIKAADHTTKDDRIQISPRLSLNTGSSMTLHTSPSTTKHSQISPNRWPDRHHISHLNVQADDILMAKGSPHHLPSPSSSKLYQRRNSVIISKLHQDLPPLATNVNSSDFEALLAAQQGGATACNDNTGFLPKQLSPAAYPTQHHHYHTPFCDSTTKQSPRLFTNYQAEAMYSAKQNMVEQISSSNVLSNKHPDCEFYSEMLVGGFSES